MDAGFVALAALLPLLVYLRTLAPTVYGLDSAELSAGAYVLGIVHSPGSPLYLLLGHWFTKLPIGDVGYRLNLMSACAAALTIVFIYLVNYELTGQRRLSLLSAWFLGFTYYVWITAVAAELYALQGTFFTALIWLALKWQSSYRLRYLNAFALLFGLGLGNHTSLVLALPGFAVLFLSQLKKLLHRATWMVPILGLLGASVFLYLPVRYAADPPLNYARSWGVDLTTLQGFWWMVSGKMFGDLFFSLPLSQLPGEFWRFLTQLVSNFLGLGVLLGAWGLAADFKKRPAVHAALFLMLLLHLAFFLTYRVSDKELMFLPVYLVWGIWSALGAAALRDWLKRQKWQFPQRLPFILLGMLASGALVVNFSYADVSQDWSARRVGEAIFEEIQPNATYLGSWLDVPILEYLQIVEDQRQDVSLVNLFFTKPEEAEQLARHQLSAGLPVYTSEEAVLDAREFELELLDTCSCSHVRYKQP